jgi:hypothetical protein
MPTRPEVGAISHEEKQGCFLGTCETLSIRIGLGLQIQVDLILKKEAEM